MRRHPTPVRASLVLAVLATTLSVVLGVALVPSDPAPPTGQAAAGLAVSAPGQRAETVSRDSTRATAGPTGTTPDAATDTAADAAAGDPATGDPASAAPDAAAASPAPVTTDPTTTDPTTTDPTTTDPAGEVPATAPPPYRLKKSKVVLRRLPTGPVPGDPFTFQIGTLNILGSQHRGNGTGRAAALAGAITGRGVDVVGLQEVQGDQLAVLQSRLGGYTIWPGQSLGNQGVRLQIAFRDDLFELVDAGSITTTFDFQQRPIPWVLLRERATGGEFHVIDIHNSPGNQSRDRYAATTEEIALVQQLRASGRPVFLMGDTNEHTTTACRIAAATGMVGSNGLSSSGGCNPGVGPIKIDHVLGVGGVDFSGHVVDYGAPVAASTDHAFVHADVTVTPLVPADGSDGAGEQ